MPVNDDRLSHVLYNIYQMFLNDARNTSDPAPQQGEEDAAVSSTPRVEQPSAMPAPTIQLFDKMS